MQQGVIDFTKGNINRQLFLFAAPMIAGNIFQQLYNLTDMVIVGRVLGREAMAAVGASAPLIFALLALIKGISLGASIVISQYHGQGRPDKVRLTADSLYLFMLLTGAGVSVLGMLFSGRLMQWLGLPEEVLRPATEYLNIYLTGLTFIFAFNTLTGVLRGIGDALTPLRFILFSALLNIALDLLFIPLLGWGVRGAAWATVIAQFCALAATLCYVNRRRPQVALRPRRLRFDRETFGRSLKLGIPTGIQQLMLAAGNLVILWLINGFGTEVIAGYAAAYRIELFVMIIPLNIGMAVTTFTAQNAGAGLYDRIRKGKTEALKLSLVASFTILLLLSGFGRPVMQLFSADQAVVNAGIRYLFVLGLSFWLFGAMFVYSGVIRGLGNTLIPMLITLLSLWLLRIPAAALLSERIGETGIWLSASFSWGIALIFSIIVYRRFIKKSNEQ